ncbi:MAG: SH3 domain-containing protein [Chloroflexi bacterium]|nr:SH3 domain-containing protein [Chloroflexota bacterium]
MEGPNAPQPPKPPDASDPQGPAESAPTELEESSSGASRTRFTIGGLDGVSLPEWLAFLRNRAILGGLATVVVLLIIAVVLVALGGGDGDLERPLAAGLSTPEELPTVTNGSELVGRINNTVSLRNGPGVTFAILGTISGGTVVSVVGRSEDSVWLQIVPPSGITGWVLAAFVNVLGDISQLAVGQPGKGPFVRVPTSVPGLVGEPPGILPTPPPAAPTSPPPAAPTSPPPPVAPTS